MEVSAIRRASITAACASVAALLASLVAAVPSPAATVTTVVKGLDNPRAVAFDSDGHLFVAEAGHGGPECITGGPGPSGETCVGFTSGISRIEGGKAHRVVDGYASLAGRDGSVAIGIDGISILNDWRLFAVEGEAEQHVPPTGFAKETLEKGKAQLGRLFEFTSGGGKRTVANVGGFDFKWSEEHKSLVPEQFPDANPYAVLATAGGDWVADAASNTLDFVSNTGKVKVVAFIPNPPVSDSVPTCVAKGRDGALYVGQLAGGGNPPGSASIWRVEPWDGDVSKWATGLTSLTGCGFDTDGDFYAVEFSVLGFETFAPFTGALVRVPPHSTKPIPVVEKLSFPNGFAARPHQIYVSNWSIAPTAGSHGATGEVLLITH